MWEVSLGVRSTFSIPSQSTPSKEEAEEGEIRLVQVFPLQTLNAVHQTGAAKTRIECISLLSSLLTSDKYWVPSLHSYWNQNLLMRFKLMDLNSFTVQFVPVLYFHVLLFWDKPIINLTVSMQACEGELVISPDPEISQEPWIETLKN